jgi:hypothetical protein
MEVSSHSDAQLDASRAKPPPPFALMDRPDRSRVCVWRR